MIYLAQSVLKETNFYFYMKQSRLNPPFFLFFEWLGNPTLKSPDFKQSDFRSPLYMYIQKTFFSDNFCQAQKGWTLQTQCTIIMWRPKCVKHIFEFQVSSLSMLSFKINYLKSHYVQVINDSWLQRQGNQKKFTCSFLMSV